MGGSLCQPAEQTHSADSDHAADQAVETFVLRQRATCRDFGKELTGEWIKLEYSFDDHGFLRHGYLAVYSATDCLDLTKDVRRTITIPFAVILSRFATLLIPSRTRGGTEILKLRFSGSLLVCFSAITEVTFK